MSPNPSPNNFLFRHIIRLCRFVLLMPLFVSKKEKERDIIHLSMGTGDIHNPLPSLKNVEFVYVICLILCTQPHLKIYDFKCTMGWVKHIRTSSIYVI